jgi:arginase
VGQPSLKVAALEFSDVLSYLVLLGLLSALDLVEVNPRLATSEEEAKATASLAVDVIASSFGQTREGSHIVYGQLPTPSSPDESENEERVRI